MAAALRLAATGLARRLGARGVGGVAWAETPKQLHAWPESSYRNTSLSSAQIKAQLPKGVTVADLELQRDNLDLKRAKEIYDEFGCLMVRGLNRAYVDSIRKHADEIFAQAVTMMEEGRLTEVVNDGMALGWVTPDQTLFIPAPKGHMRDKQVMVLGLDYFTGASMFQAATDTTTLDLMQQLLDSPNIELFSKGQCFYKEGITQAQDAGGIKGEMLETGKVQDVTSTVGGRVGGNPKYLHQDSAYFMFGKQGACATLNYTIETNLKRDNGPLYVVPGSHKFGHIPHIDTPSHLGLDAEWTFDDALCIEGEAGDALFFHIHTLHGSTPNRSPEARATFINRYITADDFQAYFATDTKMRAEKRQLYEKHVSEGQLPLKERNIVVRGRREWSAEGAPWSIDARVNH